MENHHGKQAIMPPLVCKSELSAKCCLSFSLRNVDFLTSSC